MTLAVTGSTAMRLVRAAVVAAALVACTATVVLSQEAVPATEPALRIESFATTRGYAVGIEPVGVAASVRNIGKVPIAAGTARLRFICLGALDYLEGSITPDVPALEPGAAAHFRWRAFPVIPDGALVASLAVEGIGAAPTVRVLPIHHFATPPRVGTPAAGPVPVARSGRDGASLDNGKLRVRVIHTAASVPALFVWLRTPGGWQQVASCMPLAELESGEGAQEPWWEVFRSNGARATNAKDVSSLTLTGGVGRRWRATVTLALRAGSTVLDMAFSASPLRPVRLSGIRAATLLAGEGVRGPAVDALAPELVGNAMVAAARYSGVTVGAAWQAAPPLAGWGPRQPDAAPGAGYTPFGTEWRAPGPAADLRVGALVEFHGRLFGLAPSASAGDARKIALPNRK